MELGKGNLLRTGLNILNQAIHPSHGLAWTDGSQVVLTDLKLHSGEARFGESKVLGQFEQVCGLSWAPPGLADVPSLLAVQHKKCVTVWQLGVSTTGANQWPMSQVSEIKESLPILPQGCVWHPKNTVLVVLTVQNISVFPDIHFPNGSRIKVDINTQGRIHCACWTPDGQRLVVAVGSSLHSYIWDSYQKTLDKCSFCPVFDVDSSVCSIRATVDSQIAVTTELPLDKLCRLNAAETLDVPHNGEDTGPPVLPVVGEGPCADKGATGPETKSENSVSPHEISVSPTFSDPLDLTHIRFNRPTSERSPLIYLSKKDHLTGTGQDSSHLVLVTFKKAVTMTRKATIPGILVPDLIAFNLKAHIIAVASNTCNIILIYSVIPSSMANIQQIQLESNERPKGICFLTDTLLLILVGKQKSTDTAFLPSSESDQFFIRLIVKQVVLENVGRDESLVASNESRSTYSAFSALFNKARREMLSNNLSPDVCHQNREPLFTADASYQKARPGRALGREITSPPSTASEDPSVLETLRKFSWIWATLSRPSRLSDHASMPAPPHVPPKENLQKEKETHQLAKELEILSRRLTEMQQYIFELMDFVHEHMNTKKKSSPVYPLSQDPPYVYIICQKPCFIGPAEKRDVLLCNGKLRLSAVQQLFGLSLVEMLHDSHWIVLCADSEGFIPLTFTATQTVVVRDGGLSRVGDSRDSHSGDPSLQILQVFGDLTSPS
ncbi:PREDICTED: WD repeat and coiled-coil-containing protein C2orf44 homolog isoform X1 [Dipodomys ordii]|uniref:WD repeat and coiled-coil-containing protein n=1 Tax=Dipodomys ordii TaxID=10020 RepID=A0A1S3EZS2_DIPOR|nr:PREDICTED: WD repeat and coiled-coil-containing protein C2orf44 homolog isoform X1 [Dipodomys ordii]XP_012868962.1 PREDICTED: WD repeat and coiled-coil-containing protein C2orf44 homolog isoform X1 [Dipodomys ordii]